MTAEDDRARLADGLRRFERLAIAVSGGIDSMVLAHVAQARGGDVTMLHAVSPAVPAAATARVRRHAEAGGWELRLIEAGEFDDPRYRANPVDRCYFCKHNLYGTIAGLVEGPVASGTNADDLGDFRPGLRAAEEWRVVHPYVEAGIGKAAIYRLAGALGLADLAELPAQPCLASRVETGIRVGTRDLAFIERVEADLHHIFGISAILRCRVTRAGIVVELDDGLLAGAGADDAAGMVRRLCSDDNRPFLGLRPYRRGAAFLRPAAS